MQYLEKLLDQFSDTPQHMIIKADILRRGMRLNDDIQRAGETSCLTGLSTKFESAIRQYSPPPSQFHFKADETTVDIKIDDRSPYKIFEDNEGNYYLLCGEENLGEIRFTSRPSYMDLQITDGQRCADFLTQRGPSCLCVSPIEFCAYFRTGDACKYCAFAPLWEYRIRMQEIKPFPDYNMLAEAVSIACDTDVDLKELKLNGGALYNIGQEANCIKSCLGTILNHIEPPEEITVFSQALEINDQKDLKALGVTNILFDLEVWDERLYPELVPGKAKAVGRKNWLKRLVEAVDVFGRGHEGTNFVGGLECAPKPGFITQDEALRSYSEGFEYLIQRGIVPRFTVWSAAPVLGFDMDDPPLAEFYLYLGQTIHELLEKYNVYPDLGFSQMGMDPPTLGLYCYYCYSMQFTRDYPRLIGR
jgi:hypothetical protein